ncbi:MAG TPA: MFS transporter [Rhizomicrobium sp.]|nr:MFS transporter [Rhizomicrobium sp.]
MQQDVSVAADRGPTDGPIVGGGAAAPGFSRPYRTYVLVCMMLVYVVNYLDRQILGILNPQIRAEFHVTNWQIGLLNGPVFALMYATLGIPIAIIADRVNRRNVIASSLALFSLMTFLSAFSARFWQLMLTRFGTGVGEAGTSPSVNSVLADLYPPQQRASALAFYSAGLNIGLLIAFFGGGWIGEHYGWRVAFRAAGIPGFVLALLLLATVREPQRGHVESLADTEPAPSIWSVARYLASQRSFLWMSVGTGLSSFGGYAAIAFNSAFFQAAHHLSLHVIGIILALLAGVAGAIGTYLFGVFADLFAKKDVRWNMHILIWATFVGLPFTPILYLSNNLTVAVAAAIIPSMIGACFIGPAYAMTQALVPLRMRARSAAILLFILNIIGLALAAPIVGKISDLLEPMLGAQSIRYALLTGMLTSLMGAYCYWQAARTLKADIARVSGA